MAGEGELEGELILPDNAVGLVLFAHGSGSSRRSPRNRFVARELQDSGLATLLLDLLTPEEEAEDLSTGHFRFDIPLLAKRLSDATTWASRELPALPVGYFGASTGAAAALVAAALHGRNVRAVVSRGGRPDLAGSALAHVEAPTLLIVGSRDPDVLRLNRGAMELLRCEKELSLIPGASHLFEEPGTLGEVARLAGAWFRRHLPASSASGRQRPLRAKPPHGVLPFKDRRDAGEILARGLLSYADREDVIVLALPRGGVPVAYEVAKRLHAPLDVFLVRKLGVPGQEEVAMGAIASGGIRVLTPRIMRELSIGAPELEAVTLTEQRELARRERAYRGRRPPLSVAGKTVILVDDGVATGSSMSAAVAAIRQLDPARIVVGVPVAPDRTARQLGQMADEVVCAARPEPFISVGQFYEDFPQTDDEEVRELLEAAARKEIAEHTEAVR
jgi:predicted phosphoribosyltransferase/pimeloyl-ACP methyl ester carboxylesterase